MCVFLPVCVFRVVLGFETTSHPSTGCTVGEFKDTTEVQTENSLTVLLVKSCSLWWVWVYTCPPVCVCV